MSAAKSASNSAASSATSSSKSSVNGHQGEVDVLSPVLRCLIEDLTEHLEALSQQAPIQPVVQWPTVQGPDSVSRLKVRNLKHIWAGSDVSDKKGKNFFEAASCRQYRTFILYL